MRTILKSMLAALAIATAAPASAQPPVDNLFEMIHACRIDSQRFCADVPPGHGRIALCLALYKNELSPPCYKAVTIGQAIHACREDYHRFCPGVPPGGGRVVECLGAYADEVSQSCKHALRSALTVFGHAPTRGDGYYQEKPYAKRYDDRHDGQRYGDDRGTYEQGDSSYDDDQRDPDALK